MLQRHVKKDPFDRRQALVLFLHCTFDAQFECQLVVRKCSGGIAVNIAAKLVNENDQREAAMRFGGPVIKLAVTGGRNVVCEVLVNIMIEYRVCTKPDFHAPVDLRRR